MDGASIGVGHQHLRDGSDYREEAMKMTRVLLSGLLLVLSLGSAAFAEQRIAVTGGAPTFQDVALKFAALQTVPVIALSTTSLPFGNVQVEQSKALTFTVGNTGNAALTVSGITVGGTDSSQFTVDPTTFTVNDSAVAQTMNVTFAPTSEGSKSASLSIAHNAAGSPSSVSLTGNGTSPPPRIQVLVEGLDFRDVVMGDNKILTLNIANVGGSDLSVTNISSDNIQFSVSPSTFTLSAGSGMDITITFLPSVAGTQSGTLTISSNDLDRASIKVSVSGNGTIPTPKINISSTSLDFGKVDEGTSKSLSLQISNQGTASLSITGITISSNQFSTSSAAFTVDTGASLDLAVTFIPQAGGNIEAILTITSNDPNNGTQEITLTGVGVAPAPDITSTSVRRPSFRISDPTRLISGFFEKAVAMIPTMRNARIGMFSSVFTQETRPSRKILIPQRIIPQDAIKRRIKAFSKTKGW